MDKQKIQDKLEEKVGEKKLVVLGAVALLLGIEMLNIVPCVGNILKVVLCILGSIFIFIATSAAVFASDIRNKNEK